MENIIAQQLVKMQGENLGKIRENGLQDMSIPEAEQYFSTKSARVCKPTKYAEAEGAFTNSDSGTCE